MNKDMKLVLKRMPILSMAKKFLILLYRFTITCCVFCFWEK